MLENIISKQIKKQEETLDNWLNKRNENNPFPSNLVSLIENVSYGDNIYNKMDIYQPINNKEKLPVIINIHGGGFLLGKKEVNRLYCASLALKGYVVFCVEYPLSPNAKIIDILNELIKAINKINEIAINYNGHINDTYLTGDSAGAYLCVYLAAIKNNPYLKDTLKVSNIIPSFKALGLVSGMFYTNKFDQIGMFLPKMIYGKNYKKLFDNAYYSILNKNVIGYLPPCFLITGKGDFLRHYSVSFAKQLNDNNITNELVNMVSSKSLPHAFAAMLPEISESIEANEKMIEFFNKYK